ncbi:type II toxin-antitoxin system YhaV family toxin [Bradyrhizobium sp. 31Argb]|uniref:type II toxin-antitoxin system YhaV family toxin n=1 Tax=Bradyrhizobium TaxID=374 RepID=UPI001FDAC6CF|nr:MULTISPECIES: type II toxin-antitoxin system YhaV family toxin [Bradyrhizobium]
MLAWVNDDSTLSAYESANDAYAVFRKMLKRGNPPDSCKELPAAAPTPRPSEGSRDPRPRAKHGNGARRYTHYPHIDTINCEKVGPVG